MHPTPGYRVRAEIASPSAASPEDFLQMPFDYPTAARRSLTGKLSRDPDDKSQPKSDKSCLAKALQDLDSDMRMLRAWLAPRAGRDQ
jgi:hypothetical protein